VSKAGTVLDVIETQIISSISLMQLIVTVVYTVLWGINIAPITKEKLKTKEFTVSKQASDNRKMKKEREQAQNVKAKHLRENNFVYRTWLKFKQDAYFAK
jgi:hypothetical protein